MFEMYHIALFTGIIISICALSSVQTNEELKLLKSQLEKERDSHRSTLRKLEQYREALRVKAAQQTAK